MEKVSEIDKGRQIEIIPVIEALLILVRRY